MRPRILRTMRRPLHHTPGLLVRTVMLAGLVAMAAASATAGVALAASARPAGASATPVPPPGPPFPEPVDNQAVYDFAGVLSPTTEQQAELVIDAIESQTKAEVVVYTQA